MALDMDNLLTPEVTYKLETMLSTGDTDDIARAVKTVAFDKGWVSNLSDSPLVEMQKRTALIRLCEQTEAAVADGKLRMLADPESSSTGTTARETDEDIYGIEMDDDYLTAAEKMPDNPDGGRYSNAKPDEYDESAGII